MTIDRLGPVDPVSRLNKTGKVEKTERKSANDSVSFSSEAKNLSELYKAAEEVKLAADVRADKVAELKKKINDPDYINQKVLDNVAEKIMDMFNI
jgi:negative regulator of flagellin synthesis FlgM